MSTRLETAQAITQMLLGFRMPQNVFASPSATEYQTQLVDMQQKSAQLISAIQDNRPDTDERIDQLMGSVLIASASGLLGEAEFDKVETLIHQLKADLGGKRG